MASKKTWKCTANKFCGSLEKYLREETHHREYGLFLHRFIEGDKLYGVVICDSKDTELPTAINFCPFCGFSYLNLYEKKTFVKIDKIKR